MIPREEWTFGDWVAYIDGWSFERIGTPAPPPGSVGPERRRGAADILNACPSHLRAGAAREAMALLSAADLRALFFDAGRAGARLS